ncbi:MAG: hypothetical protein IKA30_03830 [Alphaproteobacteria bacterium]|nr:hypothetical protein [Alphaproteobacteria bacterium]
MKLGYCFGGITAAMLCLCPFAFASEDSPSPFPDDYIISDLPELSAISEETADNDVVSPVEMPVGENLNIKPITVNDANNSTPVVSESSDQNVSVSPTPDTASPNLESDKPAPIFLPKAQNTPNEEAKGANVPNQSLTDTLKSDNKNNIIEGTWIEKLASVNPLSAFGTDEKTEESKELEELVKKSRGKDKNGRSNAAVFDISGIMLRMNLNQVEKTLKNRGFQKIGAKFTIPNFIKWRNEEACSSQGVIGFERMQSCINTMAKKEGHEYLYYLKYAKFDSKEEIEIYLTSNFTENKVYKIIYKSKIAAINGNSPKAIYIRNLKVYDFWKKINQKYGHPDNKNNVTWGLGGNKPFLKASTGYLLLEDPMFVEMDYTRMSREDQRYVHSDFYNF